MNKYSVTFNLPNEETFLDFVNRIGPLVGKFEVHINQTVVEPTSQLASAEALYKPERGPRAPRAKRAKRGSKVIDAILERIGMGTADTKELKYALETAGMAPSSLSTGLAILQKDGRIKRGENGYYLSVREIAA